MAKTKVVTVGGFLGAGKTTLLWEAAKLLSKSGSTVGLITNDQAPELVDTKFLARGNLAVGEVSGSCFCCNFKGLINALSAVRKQNGAEIILTEPVGSCTDLSATILQPIKEYHAEEIELAPLSVLVDPSKLKDILAGGTAGLHASAAYIMRKQLEESDAIVITKQDKLSAQEQKALMHSAQKKWPHAKYFMVSSKTGNGLSEWLSYVTTEKRAGQRIVEVDYDRYAEGEAVLGWLNATVALGSTITDWQQFAKEFMYALTQKLRSCNAAIGHVKLLIEDGESSIVSNITDSSDQASFRGEISPSSQAIFVLNARVELEPSRLEEIARQVLLTTAGDTVSVNEKVWRCLKPGRPEPTFRFDQIIEIS